MYVADYPIALFNRLIKQASSNSFSTMCVSAPRIHSKKPDNLEKACKNLAVNWIRMCAYSSYLSKRQRPGMTFMWRETQPCSEPPHVACYPLVTSRATGPPADLHKA